MTIRQLVRCVASTVAASEWSTGLGKHTGNFSVKTCSPSILHRRIFCEPALTLVRTHDRHQHLALLGHVDQRLLIVGIRLDDSHVGQVLLHIFADFLQNFLQFLDRSAS